MQNLLLEPVDYKIEETQRGIWRRFMYPNGELFEEYKSHRQVLGLPFVHYTRGRSPETGKRVTARGFIAIGRFAIGIIAIGQVSAGFIAIGQVALGVLFGLGQATTGVVALGQLALGVFFGLGQVTTGHIAIGQIALGNYALAQLGFGSHVMDMRGIDPDAEQFFQPLLR